MPDAPDEKEIRKKADELQKKADDLKKTAEALLKLAAKSEQMKELNDLLANMLKTQGEAMKSIMKSMKG